MNGRHAWDLVLRGGTIVDGTGAPCWEGDLAVSEGRVAALGARLAGHGTSELDARGLALCPGFVDIHSHADLTLAAFPDAACLLRQGVTSVVAGNCGLTAFPLERSRQGELEQYLAAFLPAAPGLAWSWQGLAGFAAEVERRGLGVNVAPLVGQGAIRLAVVGFQAEPATPGELERMVRLLEQALDEGAVGLSLGLLYPPGSYAAHDELVTLARAVGRRGRPLTVHVRNEGDDVERAVQEAMTIAREAGVALELSHQKAVGRRNWGKAVRNLRRIEQARAQVEPLDVGLDVWPYTSGSTTVTALLPAWVLEGGVDAALRRLRQPTERARAVAEMRAGTMAGEALLALVGLDGIRIAEAPRAPALEGRSLAELAAERHPGREPWDAVIELLAAMQLRGTMIIWEELDAAEVEALVASPLSAIGSDSWPTGPAAGGLPHPRTYGTFPHFLRHYVLEGRALGLEEGVRKITSLPAGRVGLAERGALRRGAVADVTVIDPAEVRDLGSYSAPHRFPAGVIHVLVDGRPAVLAGELTGWRGGRFLRAGT